MISYSNENINFEGVQDVLLQIMNFLYLVVWHMKMKDLL